MDNKDWTPIVLGADILGYSYVRELHQYYGKKSFVLSGGKSHYVQRSSFTDYETVDRIDEEEPLMKWLRANRGRFGQASPIIFGGTGDWRIRTLSKNKEELTGLGYIIPNIDFDLLDSITQKDIFYGVCAKLGVPFPRTLVYGFKGYAIKEEFDGLEMVKSKEQLKDLEYPLIAKPSNSADWRFTGIKGQHKIYTIKNYEELIGVIEGLEASPYSHALLIQEMLNTEDESLHSLTTFSDKDGNMLLGVAANVILQSHTPTGIGNPLVIFGQGKNQHLLEYAAKILKDQKYEGFANFDVMDGKDGKPRFLEVNTRPGRNTYYFSLAGYSFVKTQIEYYVNKDIALSALSDKERRMDNTFLFSVVSRDTALKSAHGENLKAMEEFLKTGSLSNPLDYKADNFIQKIFARRYMDQQDKINR